MTEHPNNNSSKIKELIVLLASPGDLQDETAIFLNIISEANAFILKVSDIRLLGIHWSTHSYPSNGLDSQDTINNEFPLYDIFVGCLNKFIGTPTPRAISGTVEEYNIAMENNKKILFYFKNDKIDAHKLNIDEFKKISEFKEQLNQDGIYYWYFSDIHDFRRYLTFHLYSHAIEYSLQHSLPFNEQSLEFSLALLSEGNMFADLSCESMRIFTMFLKSTTSKLKKLTVSILSSKKSNNRALFNTSISAIAVLFSEYSKSTKFYLETANIFMGFTLENYTKSIFGINELGQLEQVYTGSLGLKDSLLQFRDVLVYTITQFEELTFIDKLTGTTVTDDCKLTLQLCTQKMDQSLKQLDILIININLFKQSEKF